MLRATLFVVCRSSNVCILFRTICCFFCEQILHWRWTRTAQEEGSEESDGTDLFIDASNVDTFFQKQVRQTTMVESINNVCCMFETSEPNADTNTEVESTVWSVCLWVC